MNPAFPAWLPYTFSLAFRLLIVLFVSADAFNRPSYRKAERGLYKKFSPKDLTSNRLYGKALFLYVLVMELLFVGISIFTDLGVLFYQDSKTKAIFEKLGGTPSYPLFAATVVVGLQNAWFFKEFEGHLRAYLHKIAKIPAGVQSTISALRRSAFSFDAYAPAVKRGEPELRTLSVNRLLNVTDVLDRRWSKVCCILYCLRKARGGQVTTDGRFDYSCFDENFFDEYSAEYEEILDLHRALAVAYERVHEMETTGQHSQQDLESTRQTIQDDLEKLRERLYNFVACAVRSRKSSESEIVTALNKIGFRLPRIDNTPLDVMSVVYTVSGLGLVTYVFAEAGPALFANISTAEWRALLPYVPNGTNDAIQWLIATFLCHGAAALTALTYRIRLVRRNRWENLDAPSATRPELKYLVGSILGAVAGYVALLLFVFVPPTLAYLLGAETRPADAAVTPGAGALPLDVVADRTLVPALAWMPVFFLTSLSIIYYRDAKPGELDWRHRLVYLACHSVLSALVGLLSARIYTTTYADALATITPVELDQRFHLLMAGLFAVFGAWIAAFFPARRLWMIQRVFNWVGRWEAEQRDGTRIGVTLEADGGAKIDIDASSDAEWRMISDKIKVSVPHGDALLLLREGNHVRLLRFPRGRSVAGAPSEIWDMEKRDPASPPTTGFIGKDTFPKPVNDIKAGSTA